MQYTGIFGALKKLHTEYMPIVFYSEFLLDYLIDKKVKLLRGADESNYGQILSSVDDIERFSILLMWAREELFSFTPEAYEALKYYFLKIFGRQKYSEFFKELPEYTGAMRNDTDALIDYLHGQIRAQIKANKEIQIEFPAVFGMTVLHVNAKDKADEIMVFLKDVDKKFEKYREFLKKAYPEMREPEIDCEARSTLIRILGLRDYSQ